MKALILNADDFGPSPFINSGIIKGIEAGVVNSVSALVTFRDGSLRAIEDLYTQYKDQVKIGLHLSLTAGWPVHTPSEEVISLSAPDDADKRMWSFKEMDLALVRSMEVGDEIRAQLNLLGTLIGGVGNIDHINSHHGIMNIYPAFWDQLLELLGTHTVPIRSALSAKHMKKLVAPYNQVLLLPIEEYAVAQGLSRFFSDRYTFKQLFRGALKRAMKQRTKEAAAKGIKMPDYYISQYYGQPSVRNVDSVLRKISDGEIAEFMLHLGDGAHDDEAPWGINRMYYPTRELELKYLLESDILTKINDKGIELKNYGTMGR